MGDEKSLVKITTKYHCMVTGKNQMEPCEGCSNPKGCLSTAMQYKENDEMDELNEKAVVKIDDDGGVVKCAKGLDAGECGYKAGAKVCGACGAMAVASKEMSDEEEEETEEMPEAEEPMAEEGASEEAEPMAEEEAAPSPVAEEEMPAPARRRQGIAMMEDEEEEDKTWMMAPSPNSRRRAMNSMGMKSGEFDDASYICQLQRKVYPGSSDICENCPGGCQSESGMPGLVEVEGTALGILGGKVLDSGYSFDADIFVVQVQAKNGKTYEFLGDGQTGELLELKRIRNAEPALEGKSAMPVADYVNNVISASDAVEIALKSLEAEFGVQGDVVAADADIFLGHDVYAVEIDDSVNGKSYDVYVTLDGQFVGLDEWTADEAEEIEAEAAEIALKRAYSEESRMEMAKRGTALPDGSYPIKDVADLRNAIQAFGRAKDKEKAKAHIMKRAMDLGAEDLIPESWVPKKAQEAAQDEKADETSSSGDEFIASLMEFEILAQEQDLKDIL